MSRKNLPPVMSVGWYGAVEPGETMTVGELIERLHEMPSDLQVVVENYDGEFGEWDRELANVTLVEEWVGTKRHRILRRFVRI